MEKVAIRMEIVQDPGLRAAIGTAIFDNRKAIYAEALKQMQRQKMERVVAMGSPTRLALHNASFEAISSAVAHFDGRMKLNNQMADIVIPKLKQAEQERRKQSKEYKDEQAFLKLMQNHQKTMAKRRKDNEEREANGVENGRLVEKASKADYESVDKPQSKPVQGGGNIVQTVKEPLVLPASQSENPNNKIEEPTKKDAPKVDSSPVNKQKSKLFKVQQTPQDKKTNAPLPFSSALKPNKQSKPDKQPSPQQQKTENLFIAAQKTQQKAGGMFGNLIPAATGPKLFQSDQATKNTQKPPETSLFGPGSTSGTFDFTRPAGNPIFATNINQSPSNPFEDLGKTNSAPTNLFLAQPNTGQKEGDGKSIFSGLYGQTSKTSQNSFVVGRKEGSNFNKGSSGNQRKTTSLFAIGQDKNKPAQPTNAGLDNVLASKDYSLLGNAK